MGGGGGVSGESGGAEEGAVVLKLKISKCHTDLCLGYSTGQKDSA